MGTAGRPKGSKKYTAKRLREACDAYFDAISYEEAVTRPVPVLDECGHPVLDKYGHPLFKPEPVVTRSGAEATRLRWTEPPSLQELCLRLKIDPSTFSRYMQDDKLGPVAAEAKARVEAYLVARIEDKGKTAAIKFRLEHCHGWHHEKDTGPQEVTVRFDGGGDDPFG